MRSKRQIKQEEEYAFPYHYLASSKKLLNLPNKLSICPVYLNNFQNVISFMSHVKGKKILDAGCGDGRFLYEMRNLDASLWGVDYSKSAIRFAKVFNPKVNLSEADLTKKLKFKSNFFG